MKSLNILRMRAVFGVRKCAFGAEKLLLSLLASFVVANGVELSRRVLGAEGQLHLIII